MFEEQEKQLKQDGRNNGTEIGNKIYELWFNGAKQLLLSCRLTYLDTDLRTTQGQKDRLTE